ncbi:MAG TPA: TetR/AcrR family transcriptional regulator [Bryobacteraceae bacterium]|jgi:AcrR family transcriptional regulator|nr:TetR/AcrR family transcriptional regulator [Bryobacteraceae bacterium]
MTKKAKIVPAEAGAVKRRGPKPTLTADQIARAAIRVADAEGLAAVSMQRIAHEVQVTTMALYRYFSNKAALIDLMIDTAGGPAPTLAVGFKGWRAPLKEWTRRCASIYHNHPWFLQAVSAGRRLMGPNELEWLDGAFRLLGDAGLGPQEQHQAFLLLIGQVRSNAEFSAGGPRGLSARQWRTAMRKSLGKQRDRYPALMAAIDAGAFGRSPEDALEFGLNCILDGIECVVSGHGGHGG